MTIVTGCPTPINTIAPLGGRYAALKPTGYPRLYLALEPPRTTYTQRHPFREGSGLHHGVYGGSAKPGPFLHLRQAQNSGVLRSN